MNMIKKKLKSEHGISILFGLLAFMVAAMISITIITACVSAVKRVHDDIEENQARLTLLSAAKLVRHEVEESRILYVSVDEMASTTIAYNDGTTDINDPEYNAAPSEDKVQGEGPLGEEILQAVKNLEKSKFLDDAKSSSAMTVELEDDDEVDSVDVSFVMKASADKRYELYFTLKLENSKYELYMKINLENPPSAEQTILARSDGGTAVTNQSALRAELCEKYGYPKEESDKAETKAVDGGTQKTTYSLDIQKGNSGIKEYVWSVDNAEISEVQKVD